MSFLELNGAAVPVRVGRASKDERELGDATRAFDGTRLRTRRAIKRRWEFDTNQLLRSDAAALRGLLLGRGHSWPFDADTYSGKGLGATADVTTLRDSVAADLATVIDETPFDVGASVAVDLGATNISAVRDTDGDSSNWTTFFSATIANDATHYYVGAGSVKATLTGSGGSAAVARQILASPSNGVPYYLSVYIKGVVNNSQVSITLSQSGGVSVSELITPTAGVWQRVVVGGTTTNTNPLFITVAELGIGGGTEVAIDAIQLEQTAYATSYINSATPRAAGNLQYNYAIDRGLSDGFTIGAWTRGPELAQPHRPYLMTVRNGVLDEQLILRTTGTGNNDIDFSTVAEGVVTQITYSTGPPWDGGWHHVVGVVRFRPSAAQAKQELWFDGVRVATANPSDLPDLDEVSLVQIGMSPQWGGLIDDALVLPFALSDDMIAGIAGLGRNIPSLPALLATGDFLDEPRVEVEGELARIPYADFGNADGWQADSEIVSFRLHEV